MTAAPAAARPRRERIAVLLSGGVDSALALALLREAGHRLTAFYLKIWLEEELAFLGDCPWEEDLRYARAVCRELRVPLQVVPLQTEYQQAVVEYVLRALRAGRTPSPDVLCNRTIKFGAFVDRIGADYDAVASGHYARLAPAPDGHCRLLRGVDPVKDQSYFLAYLRRGQLRRLRFPLGGLRKQQVRALARERGLAPSDRRDSQGICFLGKLSYPAFVRAHLGEAPGPIRELTGGARLGSHRGHWFHTIGQRQGLGLGDGPWYVAAGFLQYGIRGAERPPGPLQAHLLPRQAELCRLRARSPGCRAAGPPRRLVPHHRAAPTDRRPRCYGSHRGHWTFDQPAPAGAGRPTPAAAVLGSLAAARGERAMAPRCN